MIFFRLRFFLLTLLLAWPSVASAQVAGAFGTRAEGPGFKIGDSFVIHPGLAVIGGYDSNMLYSNSEDPRIFGPYIALRPMLDLATLSPQRGGNTPRTLEFRLHLGAAVRFLITGDQQFNKDHIGADIDAGTLLTLFPMGKWTFDLYDNYTRLSSPPYFRILRNDNLNTDVNTLGLRLRWRPGGQRLELGFTYEFGVYAFESNTVGQLFTDKNYLSNNMQLRVSWKFFPKTAIYISAQETIYTYIDQGTATPSNSFPLRIVFGLNGLITPKLTVDINAGYANGFYVSGPSPQNASVTVNGTWSPTLRTSLGLTYNHDFSVSLIGSYYNLDRLMIFYNQMIWRIYGSLRAGWEQQRFEGNLTLDGMDNGRVDNVVYARLELNLPIRDWFLIGIGDQVDLNFSNCKFIINGAPSSVACNYVRNDFWGRLTVMY